MLEQETAKGIDTLAAKTQEVMEQKSRLPGGQAQALAAMTEPEEYMVRRPLSELEHRAAQWMLEEFKARNQVAYERYDSLTKQEQGIMDRWQALEYRLNPPAALVTGNQNGKLSVRNDPYGIIDTPQPVGYDKGKEGSVNEQFPAWRGWGQPNRTNPGRPNAYAEYLAYKQKVQARQQSLALEQALQQLLVQEQAARVAAGPQAFAYNGADGFASDGYETGGAAGTGGTGSSGGIDGGYEAGDSFKQGDLDSSIGADSVFSVGDTGEPIDQILSEGKSETQYGDDFWKMGKYVEHPDVEVDWSQYSQHGLEQMEKRGLTREMVDSFVKSGKALSQSNGEKFAFVTKEGVAVVTKDGKLITAWGSDNFDNNMVEIIKKLFGD